MDSLEYRKPYFMVKVATLRIIFGFVLFSLGKTIENERITTSRRFLLKLCNLGDLCQ